MILRQVIGLHACREALKLRSSKELKKIYFRPEWKSSPALKELEALARAKNLKPELMALKKMDKIGLAHQGVCLELSGGPKWNPAALGAGSAVLILDRIQDPKNFGAIIRTAWLMGAEGLFASSRGSAPLSPSAAKAASGGAEHIPIEQSGSLKQYLRELKENQFWIYALDSESGSSLWAEKFEGRAAFLIGGESGGARPSLKKACDKILSIPQKNKSASYNVSVAAALALGEYRRQNQINKKGNYA